MKRTSFYPIAQALLAAGLFGASAPFAKLLLGEVQPIPLAALLYLGSGAGMLLLRVLRRGKSSGVDVEARVSRADVPWLAGAVLAGGVAAPIVLLFSLRDTPAATASLLLNFEGVATTLIAALAFKEAIGRRVWLAIACVAAASVLLSWQTGGNWGISLGAGGIVLACVLWGLDNNFTRNVSAKDPTAIVTVKGLAAGAFSFLLALGIGSPLPGLGVALAGLLLGFVCYGLSIMLFVRAMRGLGAARTSALFGAAPFVGALLSFVVFRESFGMPALIAVPLMVVGAALLIGEDHRHVHTHDVFTHEHRHTHDDGHHRHAHPGADLSIAHSHMHRHATQRHAHPHTPDLHHRHDHPQTT
ncbi:MAG: EamA family transporter [Chloroflexi bacterium]|nr:EamA family transporter [Chloroflexota bacterium]MCL5273266.1 EamA family transporter [Chloroflexota bacterium]